MRKFVLSIIAILSVGIVAMAQNQKVTGTVTDADGQTLVGATVHLEGTGAAVVTGLNGEYSISAPSDGVLVFACLGMVSQKVDVAGKTVLNVEMKADAQSIADVIVTAQGMTRSEKTLGYSATKVDAEEITKGHASSVMSGLVGKVAGMNISQSGGTGTSQKVVVRGYSSLGSNNPLYVIDGVPIQNSFSGSSGLNNSVDFGNQAGDVNPDEVESVTVLKGASATALYGSRAANGVIIMTTKRGKQNEMVKVTYNGSFMASDVLRTAQTQKWFGQGWQYPYYSSNYYGTANSYFGDWASQENGSWGPRLDGRDHEWNIGAYTNGQADQLVKKFSQVKNSLRHFYETGFETNNTVSIQGGNERTGFMFTYGNTYSDGILPGSNDYYKRNTFSFRGNTTFKKFATFAYSISYVRKDARNSMTGQGGSGSTIYNDIMQMPIDIDWADLKDYNSVYNNADNYITPYAQNPWWVLDHNYAQTQDDRVYGSMELNINIVKGLKAIGRLGGDFTNSTSKYMNDVWAASPGSYNAAESTPETGNYSEGANRWNQIDASGLLSADYRLGNFSVNAIAGVNVNQRQSHGLAGSLEGLGLAGWASLLNTSGANTVASSSVSKRRLVGLLAQADLGYKDFAYLTLSARNDWSSTLPINDNSFFYWGANASLLVTDMIPSIKNNVLSFLKIRAAYGQTGNDAGTYLTSATYSMGSINSGFGSLTFPIDSFVGGIKSTRIPNTNLKPEISTELEFGIDLRLFNNRIRVDASYYDKDTNNQIISATTAPETGYTSRVRNVGKINNKGIELMVGLVPIQTKNFTWDLSWVYSKNKNTVKELWDGLEEYTIYGLTGSPQLKAMLNGSLSTWVFNTVQTVEDENSPYYGCTIVNANTGYPLQSSDKTEIIGSADPKYTMGLSNQFTYKNLSLGFTFDYRNGGMMYSASKGINYFVGNSEESAYNYRHGWIYPNSVKVVGGQYVENNVPVDIRNTINAYWNTSNNVMRNLDNVMLSKTFLKLREVNITYTLPKSLFSGKLISGVEVSLVGRNLLMWTPDQGYVDPEMTNYGNDLTSEFGEYYGAPSTRTFGGSIKLVF